MPPGEAARQPAARKWRNLDCGERANGGETPLKKPGAGTTAGRTGEHGHPARYGREDAAPARVALALPGAFHAATPTGAAIPVKSRKKRKSGDHSGPERTMTRPGHFERKSAVFSKSRAGKKRRKRPLLRNGPKIKGKERRT